MARKPRQLKLTETQRYALRELRKAASRSRFVARPAAAWLGAREGVSGSTLMALADKGLAQVRWTDKPYRRLVGRITPAGLAWIDTREPEAKP